METRITVITIKELDAVLKKPSATVYWQNGIKKPRKEIPDDSVITGIAPSERKIEGYIIPITEIYVGGRI